MWGVSGSALRQDQQQFAPFSVRMELFSVAEHWLAEEQLCRKKAGSAGGLRLLGWGSVTIRLRNVVLHLCSVLVGKHLEGWSSSGHPSLRETHTEGSQSSKGFSAGYGLEHRTFEVRGKQWGCLSINSWRLVRMLLLPIATKRECLGKAQAALAEWQETTYMSWNTENYN